MYNSELRYYLTRLDEHYTDEEVLKLLKQKSLRKEPNFVAVGEIDVKVNDIGKTSKNHIAEKLELLPKDVNVEREVPARWEVDRERGLLYPCQSTLINGTFHGMPYSLQEENCAC